MGNSDKYVLMKNRILQQYGPIIGGQDLRNFLGYKAASTFNRAKRLKLIDFPLFKIPNRRGSFALTENVVDWIQTISEKNCSASDDS